MVARVHHDALGAHVGAGHHRRRYPCPYVPTVMLLSKLDEIDASRPVSIVAAADESFFSPTSFNVTISFQKLRTYNHYIWGKALAALFLPGNVFHAFSLTKFSFSFF
jgi:hypothetical protein